jgi:hypothetical protein
VRVNHGNGGRRGDHRFYRAAAFAQDRQRALAGKMVGRNGHAVCQTLLCMKSPRNPESHKVLQKLFQF